MATRRRSCKRRGHGRSRKCRRTMRKHRGGNWQKYAALGTAAALGVSGLYLGRHKIKRGAEATVKGAKEALTHLKTRIPITKRDETDTINEVKKKIPININDSV